MEESRNRNGSEWDFFGPFSTFHGQGAEGAFCGPDVSASLLYVGFRSKFSYQKLIQFQNSKLSSRSKSFFLHRGTPEFHYQKQRNYGVYSTQALSNESKQELEPTARKNRAENTGLPYLLLQGS